MMASAGDGETPQESNEKAVQQRDTQTLPQQPVASLDTLSNVSKGTTSPTVQNLINYVLHFLSIASNKTLGTCTLALGATIYLVLGRVGLVLIGVTGGIVLHATWEGVTGSGGDDEVKDREIRRRKEVGLDVVARVLDWRQNQGKSGGGGKDGSIDTDVLWLSQGQQDFADFQPATGAALTRLVDAVIRDYIQ